MCVEGEGHTYTQTHAQTHTRSQCIFPSKQGQFLVMGESDEEFSDWLAENVPSMNKKHRGDLTFCLQEWIKRNL